ncbi:MAG: carbon-nitrogen hydrolase [Acidimicrobiia bacterium]|nr:MAG: carbon-nitrogen hydrolase [Acidimicrobiia bacterium]
MGAPEENFRRLAPMIEEAAARGARLVACTEMFSTGFSMASDRVAEPEDGPSAQFLRGAGAHPRPCGCADRSRCGRTARRAVQPAPRAWPPDGAVHHYDKIHPFSYSGEHEHYASGEDFLTLDVEGVRVSFFVCYDLRFADEFWALASETDCYVVVANWPESRRAHWRTLLPARAIENQAYVVGVNRVGDGNGTPYVGDSVIVDPFGEVLAEAPPVECVVDAPVSTARVREVRSKYPFLADRRTPRAVG